MYATNGSTQGFKNRTGLLTGSMVQPVGPDNEPDKLCFTLVPQVSIKKIHDIIFLLYTNAYILLTCYSISLYIKVMQIMSYRYNILRTFMKHK